MEYIPTIQDVRDIVKSFGLPQYINCTFPSVHDRENTTDLHLLQRKRRKKKRKKKEIRKTKNKQKKARTRCLDFGQSG